MGTLADHKLDQQIYNFLDRKTEQFPELDRIVAKHERASLLTRVQDMVTSVTHTRHPKHIH